MSEPGITKEQLDTLRDLNAWVHIASIANHDSPHATATTGGNTQTVIHHGLGAWGPAAIVACFCTIFLMVVITVVIEAQNSALQRRIETLEAWNGVNNNVITKMQTTIEYLNKDNKP